LPALFGRAAQQKCENDGRMRPARRLRNYWEVVMIAKVALLTLALVPDAHAYIDPGSGSLLLQMLVAGAIGAFFKFRTALTALWQSIKSRWN
jgi:hypothetical protein